MKKILLSPLALVSLVTSCLANPLPQTVDTSVKAKAEEQLKIQNREIVKLVVAEISKKLPQRVDKYTEFVKIENDDLKLLYTYEINTGSKSDKSVREEDKKRMEGFVVRGICQTSKRFLESNIDISYIYNSAKSKEELFRFDVTSKDCKYL